MRAPTAVFVVGGYSLAVPAAAPRFSHLPRNAENNTLGKLAHSKTLGTGMEQMRRKLSQVTRRIDMDDAAAHRCRGLRVEYRGGGRVRPPRRRLPPPSWRGRSLAPDYVPAAIDKTEAHGILACHIQSRRMNGIMKDYSEYCAVRQDDRDAGFEDEELLYDVF